MQQVALPSFPRSFRRRSLGDHAHHDLRLDEYVPRICIAKCGYTTFTSVPLQRKFSPI